MAHAHAAPCDHDHDHSQALAPEGVARELAEAEARCSAADQRLTPPRRRVLELLLETGQPAKAYDLIAAFGPDGKPAKPPTVYRALEFLEKQGLAHRIESMNAYVACRMGEAGHDAAFLICDCCGATREIDPSAAAAIGAAGAASGYAVSHVTIEAHGKCADCQG